MMIIRKIKDEDIEKLVEININAWKKAYKGIIDKDILDNLDKNKKIEKWKNHYHIENIIVAEENGKIMGYCRYSDEVASKPIAGADSEVMALYVDCEYQRMGIGKALIKEVIEKLKMLNKKRFFRNLFD